MFFPPVENNFIHWTLVHQKRKHKIKFPKLIIHHWSKMYFFSSNYIFTISLFVLERKSVYEWSGWKNWNRENKTALKLYFSQKHPTLLIPCFFYKYVYLPKYLNILTNRSSEKDWKVCTFITTTNTMILNINEICNGQPWDN